MIRKALRWIRLTLEIYLTRRAIDRLSVKVERGKERLPR